MTKQRVIELQEALDADKVDRLQAELKRLNSEAERWYERHKFNEDQVKAKCEIIERLETDLAVHHAENCKYGDENVRLRAALNDLLNDCINFDGGKLTDCIMQQASDALKGKTRNLCPHGRVSVKECEVCESLPRDDGVILVGCSECEREAAEAEAETLFEEMEKW